MLKKIIFLACILLLCANTLSAQDRKFGTAAYIGYDAGLVEYSNNKIQFGLNPYYDLTKRFAVESQLSATFYKGRDITGTEITNSYTHLLIGVRYYLLIPERNWRPHINVLYGYLAGAESDMVFSEFTGLSTGIYISKKKGLYFGVAFETEDNIVFKAGYRF